MLLPSLATALDRRQRRIALLQSKFLLRFRHTVMANGRLPYIEIFIRIALDLAGIIFLVSLVYTIGLRDMLSFLLSLANLIIAFIVYEGVASFLDAPCRASTSQWACRFWIPMPAKVAFHALTFAMSIYMLYENAVLIVYVVSAAIRS